MKLTKKENKIVIQCLTDIQFLNKTNKNPFISSIDLEDLPLIIEKFKNYQKGL